MTQHLLSARLNEAFTTKPVKVKIPVQHLMEVNESKDDGLDVSLNLPEPAGNDIWLKFGKNWGDVRGDTDYHSTATLLGWDKQVAPGWRAGVKQAFAGAEPGLRYSYMGDRANTYDMRNVQDKTHFVLSICGEVEVAKGWSVGGDAAFQCGRHDKDWPCGITVKRMW